MLKSFVFMAALAFGPAAFAQDTPVASEEDGLQMIMKQQKELKADLDDGGIEGLTPRQVKVVRKAQDEVFAVAEGKAQMDDLSIDEKIRLENALERINAEIVNTRSASNNQNVCWRERVSGSTLKKTRCGTQAEMREAREGARDFMEKAKICVPPGCGG
jgi:hypothetical protein